MIRTMRFGTELRRFFRTKMTSLAILVAICIPLLYGALYLWAFWNPYDRLDHLAVAIVNEDRAVTTSDGTVVHAGSDVEKAIVDKHTLDWHETTASEATSGLAANTYYAVVTIPENFSASVASVSGSSPIAAPINVTYDDANGYTTRTLLASVMRELRSGVSATLGESMVERTLLGLNDISTGLTTAHSGAVTLADGTSALSTGAAKAADGASAVSSGASTLATGAAQAATGAGQLQVGAASLADGAAQADSGAQQLAAGAGTLASSAGSLASGAQSLSSGLGQASTGASALASASTQLAAGATSVSQGNQALAAALASTADNSASTLTTLGELVAALPDSDPRKASLTTELATLSGTLGALKSQSQTVATGAAGVATGASTLAQEAPALSQGVAASAQGAQQLAGGSSQLSAGATQLATKAGELAAGTQKVSAGASQLADKSGELATGVAQVSDGATTLAGGASDLATGTRQVADGATSADEGAAKLRDGLKTALDKVPTFDNAASTATVMSDPVSLDSGWSNEASSMGEGYAPYFVGLALYVGALILWMLLRPISKRSLAAPVSALRLVLSGALPSWALGLAQVAVLFGVLIGALGLHPTHLVATLAFAVLVSIAFVSLQQTIAIWLGPAVGRLVVLVLLMLQLTSAGGTFPAATTPLFFRVLHVILPMTRVVDGFRESLTGDLSSVFATSVTYLVVLIALNVGMATWGAARLRTWTITRLHPDVTL